MEVTTLLFLGFFAAVTILNYALPRVARPYFLLAASYAFFCWSPTNRALLPVLLTAALVSFSALSNAFVMPFFTFDTNSSMFFILSWVTECFYAPQSFS